MTLKAISASALLAFTMVFPATAAALPVTSGPAPAAVDESGGMSIVAAKHKPKAALAAIYTTQPNAKVKVQLHSNSTKVQVKYRTARNVRRSTSKKVKNGAATFTLRAGSKRITVRARATKRLAASPWIRATPQVPADQTSPVQYPAPGGAATESDPVIYTEDTYVPPAITYLTTYATAASGTWEIVSEYRIVAPMPYILTGDVENDYNTIHPAGERIIYERELNPGFTPGDECMARSTLRVLAPSRGGLDYTYSASDGTGGDLMPYDFDTMYYPDGCPIR